jgi:hypothetical protein
VKLALRLNDTTACDFNYLYTEEDGVSVGARGGNSKMGGAVNVFAGMNDDDGESDEKEAPPVGDKAEFVQTCRAMAMMGMQRGTQMKVWASLAGKLFNAPISLQLQVA